MSHVHLHTQVITEKQAEPRRHMLMLHGLFGWGRNWAAIARQVVAADPQWAITLMDLPEHGQSSGFAGPATIEAAAHDAVAWATNNDRQFDAILGHSLGGKVALSFVDQAIPRPKQVFIVESSPARIHADGPATGMIRLLSDLSGPFGSRQEAHALLTERGVTPPVAQWMAMNLVERGDQWQWRFRLRTIESFYESFRTCDLWHVLSEQSAAAFHFLKASRDSVIDVEAARRLRGDWGYVRLHEIDGGHWLHIDQPKAVAELISRELQRIDDGPNH